MDVEIEGSEAEAVVDEGVDNPVLSQALEYEKLSRDPFSAFWDTSETTDASAVVVELPKIRLDATMPGQGMPLAVVDGSMRFLGDSIQGWTVDHISDRAITLRAPSSDTYVVEMPILHGQISVPLDAMIVEAPESTITPLAENADLPEASPLGVLTPELPETESDADAPPSIESTDPTDPTSDETGADF
jgi:hypothetical protein